MSDASGLLALGRALDDYLVGEYSPPPGTQTALGFLAGVSVDPATFQNNGVVNPALVQVFLNLVVNRVAPVVGGRFVGSLLPAHQLYAALLAVGMPLAPLGTPAADAFLALKTMAGSAFGVLGAPKDVVTAPSNWFDPAGRGGWSSFSTTSSGSSGSSEGSSGGATPRPAIPPKTPRPTKPSPGETPPIIAQEQFEQLWQWRKLDTAAMAEVVLPASKAVETAPAKAAKPVMMGSLKIQPDAVVRDHRTATETPIVRDHRALDISDVSVAKAPMMASFTAQPAGELKLSASPKLAMRAVDAEPMIAKSVVAAPVDRIMATAPRRQLTDLVDAESVLVTSADSKVKSQAMAKLIADRSPVLIADFKRDGETASTQRVESQALTLSLEYCFVQISRDAWWNEMLLRMPWCAPGLKAGDLVPGRQSAGLPVGVPIAMVVTRNVRVSGRWSEADRAAADSHTSFGPWEMSRSKMSFDSSRETATLEIPDTQVVAVVCSLLPSLPPADDPALVASKPPLGVPPVISLTPEIS
jgi:hypothetical protein